MRVGESGEGVLEKWGMVREEVPGKCNTPKAPKALFSYPLLNGEAWDGHSLRKPPNEKIKA